MTKHDSTRKQPALPLLGIAEGMCQCGCGRPTKRARQKQKGYAKGDYQRFIQGHGTLRASAAVHLKRGHCRHGHNLRDVGQTTKGDCRQCAREAAARHRHKHPHLGQLRRRRRQLKTFGLTPDAYDALAARQQGGCAICRHCPATHQKALCVDHDHETGVVRGLLCESCNLAVGKFRDSPDLLRAAAAYLDRARAAATLKAI